MKKGFTLIELLAVITVIALLSIMFLPDIMEKLNESLDKSMKINENQLVDSTNIVIETICRSDNVAHVDLCKRLLVNRVSNDKVYFCSNIILNIQKKEIHYDKDTLCNGIIVYDNKNGTRVYSNGKAYLICGDEYSTEGANNYRSEIEGCLTNTQMPDPEIFDGLPIGDGIN